MNDRHDGDVSVRLVIDEPAVRLLAVLLGRGSDSEVLKRVEQRLENIEKEIRTMATAFSDVATALEAINLHTTELGTALATLIQTAKDAGTDQERADALAKATMISDNLIKLAADASAPIPPIPPEIVALGSPGAPAVPSPMKRAGR